MKRREWAALKPLSLTLAGALLLTGCASSRKDATTGVRKDATIAARSSVPDVPDVWAAAQEAVGDVQVGWVAALQDETLKALVGEAQANNRDLQAAAASVERSWALARQAGAALKPSVDLAVGGTGSGTFGDSSTSGNLDVGVRASWELDIWGRLRAGRQAAVDSAAAAEADLRYAQHSLAAAVANAYFVAIEAGLQANVTRDTLDALTETNRIVKVQYEHGFATSQDLALSKSDLATARAGLAAAEGSQRDALRALELLLGRYPAADVQVRESLPEVPAAPPAGVPSEILERRPDLVAAERRVAAAFNTLDEARTARLPSISLTASAGAASDELSSLVDPGNLTWSLGTNLLAPIFRGGALKAQVDAATAEQKQTIAAYGQAALRAFKEVEAGLDQNVVLSERDGFLRVAAEKANEALRVVRLRHQEGEVELLDVLLIQRRGFTAESNRVSVERARLEQWVSLNLALGGSWQ
jgi:NodT family efflux transporter outer membrane factor (OMF) lipoprotein